MPLVTSVAVIFFWIAMVAFGIQHLVYGESSRERCRSCLPGFPGILPGLILWDLCSSRQALRFYFGNKRGWPRRCLGVSFF
jgi:hypothetical protein